LGRNIYRVTIDVLRRPSLAFAFASLLVTYLGKILWHIDMLSTGGATKMGFLAFFAEDLLVMALVIVAVFGIETLWPRRPIKIATAVLMALVALLSALNMVWLRKTGFQLTASVIEIGITRFEEIKPIVFYEIGATDLLGLLAVLLLPALLSLLFHLKWKKSGAGPRQLRTLAFPVLLLVLAALGYWQQQNPDLLGWRRIADNLLGSVIGSLAREDKYASMPEAPRIVLPDAGAAAGPRPNIVVVLLESVSHRATSLDPAVTDATPFLERFGAEGLVAERMRVVMPHSTKTFYSALCGKIPALQQDIVETADNFPLSCLPSIFRERGYRTAFAQASEGWFEDLPRLASKAGFDEFYDWYGIQPSPERMGYLGADDAALEGVALDWVSHSDDPYFLVLFTSSTHHPYILPRRIPIDEAARSSRSHQIQRYLTLVHDTDRTIGRLLERLEERGDAKNTIVVLMGDHGESFGDHGQFQHDNIFTDEGLRIPFAIRAPGRIEPGTRVRENRSVLDLAPTLLQLAGVPFDEGALDGTTLLEPIDGDARQYFSCFYNEACVGFVQGDRKVVYFPDLDSWLEFDLAQDDKEIAPLMEGELPPAEIEALDAWYTAHRYHPDQFNWSEAVLFDGRWRCFEGYGKCYPKRDKKN